MRCSQSTASLVDYNAFARSALAMLVLHFYMIPISGPFVLRTCMPNVTGMMEALELARTSVNLSSSFNKFLISVCLTFNLRVEESRNGTRERKKERILISKRNLVCFRARSMQKIAECGNVDDGREEYPTVSFSSRFVKRPKAITALANEETCKRYFCRRRTLGVPRYRCKVKRDDNTIPSANFFPG